VGHDNLGPSNALLGVRVSRRLGRQMDGLRDARFNLDLHAVTEAPENLAQALNRIWSVLCHRETDRG
jgi:hypothetical protein